MAAVGGRAGASAALSMELVDSVPGTMLALSSYLPALGGWSARTRARARTQRNEDRLRTRTRTRAKTRRRGGEVEVEPAWIQHSVGFVSWIIATGAISNGLSR